ncbi:MAG: alkene reductase, partial [Phycisphaerales bacterium]
MQLMQSLTAGSLRARNRVWMAPLTRCRAPGGEPTALNATYYTQRAGAGVIVSEATNISREAT